MNINKKQIAILLFLLMIGMYYCVSVFDFTGTPGSIMFYIFDTNYINIENELQEIYKKDSSYIKYPTNWVKMVKRNRRNLYFIKVLHYTYFDKKPSELYEVYFIKSNEIELSKQCTLALVGIYNGNTWNFKRDISSDEKDRVTSRFEKEILSKLSYRYEKED